MSKLSVMIICAALLCPTAAAAPDQTHLTTMSGKDMRSADKELNAVYQQVLKKFSSNSAFIAKLRQAELDWIKFRDAYTDSVFPEAKTNPDRYGSAVDMCVSATLAQQTVQRTNDLKKLLGAVPAKNADAQNKLAQASTQVSKLYQTAVKKSHDDEPTFAAKFKKAQDTWITFANADAETWSALAQVEDAVAVKTSRLAELNQARAKSLNEWVKGIPEGDVCTGSRAIQE